MPIIWVVTDEGVFVALWNISLFRVIQISHDNMDGNTLKGVVSLFYSQEFSSPSREGPLHKMPCPIILNTSTKCFE